MTSMKDAFITLIRMSSTLHELDEVEYLATLMRESKSMDDVLYAQLKKEVRATCMPVEPGSY